ncbi:MAG: hypothetical protein ABI904_04355 [Chloroflexota bacterium]
MDFASSEKEVIDLLSKLKNSAGSYPSEIFTARRQAYIRQVANIGLGIGVCARVKNAAKGGNGAAGTVATVTSKILETALIAAIAIEAGAVAYLYRDKIAELVRTYISPSSVQGVTPPAGDESSSSSELMGVNTEAPTVVTVSTPSVTVTTTVTVISGTPSPEVAGDTSNSSNNNGSTTNINATPKPNGNNGNQYGLTPKPERTKDNNGGSNNNGGNKNNGGGNNKKP